MYKSKLIDIYLSLNIEEKRHLRKWIKSDFVCKNDIILSFFNFIDTRNKINEKTISKLKAHEYLFPNSRYDDLRIRHLMSICTDIFESFIIYNRISNNLTLSEQLLSEFYIEKDLYKHAQKSIEVGFDLLEKSLLKNSSYYKSLFELNTTSFEINSKNIRTYDLSIDKIVDSFSVFVIIETLKTSSRILSIKKVGETNAKHYFLESVVNLLKNSNFLELTQVRIYYNIYLITSIEDEDAFKQFIIDIKPNENLFTKHDLNELYRLAINFCIKKSNQNNILYTKQTFELYLYTIENNILIENNEISRFTFTNIISLGLKLNEFDSNYKFIEKYKNLIHKEFRKNTIDFNTSKILFAERKLSESLKILKTNEFKDVIWSLNSKQLILKIYFEINDFESFKTHLKAFKTYIKRKSNIGYHKTYFSHVTDALTKLLEVYKKPEKYKNFKFESTTPDADWFNKMLEEIKTKKAPK